MFIHAKNNKNLKITLSKSRQTPGSNRGNLLGSYKHACINTLEPTMGARN